MMKNWTVLTMFLSLFFVGCEYASVEVEEDVVSYKTSEWDISIKRSVFTSRDVALEKGCAAVNEVIKRLMDSLQNDLEVQLNRYLQKAGEMKVEPMLPFSLYVEDSVFMADRHYISVRFSVYTMTGGANGLTEYYAFNYDVRNQKFLTPPEILNYNKSTEIDQQIKANFKSPEKCFTGVPTLANFTVVNFTVDDFCFTYNPLVLGAHYCGAAEVNVPRMTLKGDVLLK